MLGTNKDGKHEDAYSGIKNLGLFLACGAGAAAFQTATFGTWRLQDRNSLFGRTFNVSDLLEQWIQIYPYTVAADLFAALPLFVAQELYKQHAIKPAKK